MLYETTNTYEATWYLMNGAILTNVTFARSEYGVQYTLVLDGVEDKFKMYWKQGRPFGNVRYFSYTRVGLKKSINRFKREYEAKMSQGKLQE